MMFKVGRKGRVWILDEHSIDKHDLYIISLPSLASSAVAALLGSTISFFLGQGESTSGYLGLAFLSELQTLLLFH